MLRSRRRFIAERVHKISCGVISALTDLVLSELAVLAIATSDQRAPHSVLRLERLSYHLRDQWKLEGQQLLNAIRKLREKGWISRDLCLTIEGQRRLTGMMPVGAALQKKWNGRWYIVTFDIPEKLRGKRDQLRSVLKALNYTALHESVWVSVHDYVGDVQEFVRDQSLGDFVILAESDALGTGGSRRLAERLWGLDRLNQEYEDWVKKCERVKRPTSALYFKFVAIRRTDPCLPRDLLPQPWYGEEAMDIFQKHFSAISKSGKSGAKGGQ